MPSLASAWAQMAPLTISDLVMEMSAILILLGAALLLYRTNRERYFLLWNLGWVLYVVHKVAAATAQGGRWPESAGFAHVSYILSITLFAAAVLSYTNSARHLKWVLCLAVVALDVAIVRSVWLPHSTVAMVLVFGLYSAITATASVRMALFSRGRRQLGPWLLTLSLLLLHLDETQQQTHRLLGADLIIDVLLGVGMMIVVLEQSHTRNRQLSAVNAITKAIALAQDPSPMLQTALTELGRLVDAQAAWFRLLHGDELVLVQHTGLSDRFLEVRPRGIPIDDAVSGRLVHDAQPTLLQTDRCEGSLRQLYLHEGFEHVVLVPVRGKNSVIGVLALASARHRTYTPAEMHFLSATCNQVGIAVENLRMFEVILRSQRQWVSTFDSIDDLVLLHDSRGRIMKVNRAMLRRVGKNYNEVIKKSCEEALPHITEWKGCPYCYALNFNDSPDPCFGGYSMVTTSSYSEEGSDRLGTIHIVRDTTERRAAEEKYRRLFEQVQEGVFVSTPEGRLLEFNDAFQRMLGYSRETLLRADVARLLYTDPEQRMFFRRQMEQNGFVRNFEVTLRRVDGRLLHALETSFATRNAEGQIERYQGVLLDVTEQKRVDEELRRRNRELHALNSVSVVASQSFDLDEILNVALRYVVDMFAADTGSVHLYDASERRLSRRAARGQRSDNGAEMLISEEFWHRIRASHTEVITHQHRTLLPSEVAAYVEAEGLRSWLWVVMWSKDLAVGLLGVACRSAREFGPSDESVMVGLGRQLATVIEKVRLYEQTCRAYDDLRRTQEQLLQSEKMSAVGQLISGVAHELNNPLTAILGYSQLLETEPIGDRGKDMAQKIFRQAQRTHRVVQNLLSFARQRKPLKTQVDLSRVLEDTLALREYDLKLNNIEVTKDIGAPLPPVTADPHQMEQVFLNIINNAADAMLEGEKSGRLRVRIFAEDGHVCAEFHDSGPGIKDPKRVFDPFYTTKSIGKGTGLGLSICYGIVKEHGGDIQAANHEGGGAVFHLRLPRTDAPAAKEKPRPLQVSVMLQGRVLLVDDEDAVLEFEREVLTGAGAEVVAVNRGEQAWQLLQTQNFDAIVLDGKMPGAWSGLDILQWVQANRPELASKILLTLSSLSDPATHPRVESSGAEHLHKPFEINELIATLRRIMTPGTTVAAGAGDD